MWALPLTSHLDGTAFASPAATAPEECPVTVTQAFIPPATHSATPSQNELSIPGVGFDASKRLKETQRDSKRLTGNSQIRNLPTIIYSYQLKWQAASPLRRHRAPVAISAC